MQAVGGNTLCSVSVAAVGCATHRRVWYDRVMIGTLHPGDLVNAWPLVRENGGLPATVVIAGQVSEMCCTSTVLEHDGGLGLAMSVHCDLIVREVVL